MVGGLVKQQHVGIGNQHTGKINAAALAAGIAPAVIAEGLERTVLPGMRGKLVRSGGVTYLNDAYNANPGSMRAAFEHLAEFADPGKLILLLGEMRELGPESEAAHREIYGLAARLFPGARIVTVGDGFRNAGGGAMQFGKSRARMIMPDEHRKKFDDVAGCDEAKEETKEIVDYLKDPLI